METRLKQGTQHHLCADTPSAAHLGGTRKVIVFGLRCHHGHEFEGWFRSNADFEAQQADGHLSCPSCTSSEIEKAIMAPNLALGGFRSEPPAPTYGERPDLTDGPETVAQLEAEIAEMRRQIKEELRTYVEVHCDYVGEDFIDEARRRYADPEARGVFGEADLEEMIALVDEGLPVAPLPEDVVAAMKPKKLN